MSVCPDFSVSILSAVRILSGFKKKKLSVVCLSDWKSTRQSCPDFHRPCPPTSDGYSKLDFLLDNFH